MTINVAQIHMILVTKMMLLSAEDDDENDSLCELSVSTSVAFRMNTSVADNADSDSDDQHDDYPFFERPHCIIKLNSTVNNEENSLAATEKAVGFPSEII